MNALTDLFPRNSAKLRSFADEAPARLDVEERTELDRAVTWHVPPAYLIERVLLGDPIARDALIEVVFRMGRKVLRSFDETTRDAAVSAVTEQLLSHGMLGLGLAYHFDLSKAGAFGTWLARLLKRAALDELRKRTVPTVPYETVGHDESGDEIERLAACEPERHDSKGMPVIPGADHDDALRGLIDQERLAIALATLNEQEKSVIVAIAHGDTPKEIGKRLRLSASRIRSIITKARAKARAAVGEEAIDE